MSAEQRDTAAKNCSVGMHSFHNPGRDFIYAIGELFLVCLFYEMGGVMPGIGRAEQTHEENEVRQKFSFAG